MKNILLILASLAVLNICSAADLVDLNSTDGRSISVLIDNYNPRKNEVAVRINGNGSLMAFKLDRLDDASQQTVKEWYKRYSVVKSLTIRTERIPAKDRDDRLFDIELSSVALIDIEDVRIDYSIPIKESSMVEPDGQKAKKVFEERIVAGSIDVGKISAGKSRHVNSESVTIRSSQTIEASKGVTKEIVNKHSIKGILLQIYIGDQMVREYESQHGVKQIIEKYSK